MNRPARSRAGSAPKAHAPAAVPAPTADADQAQKYELAKIRHELRTPINHIIGYSEMLEEEAEGRLSERFLNDLHKIQAVGKELLGLVNHFFEADRPDGLKLDPSQVMHELRTPVNHIVGYSEMLQEEAVESGQQALVPDLQRINTAARHWLALMETHLLSTTATAHAEKRRLPKPEKAAVPALGTLFRPAPPKPAARPPSPASLLVVDDDEAIRDLLARRLQREGYRVAVAKNGRHALVKLRTERFDLVLLDLLMPGLDGYQVLEALKTDEALRHIPVIMISALDDVAGIVRCIEIGAEDYLAKPFNPVFLRARIGAALEQKRLRDQEHVYLRRLQEEQEKTERLLLSILPKAIAQRIKQGEVNIAEGFDEVTVLFADLVGFTAFAAEITTADVVRVLNEIFSAFDLLADRHGLEKIKTIGDSYMAVAGLPTPRADHTEAAAAMALDMQSEMERFNAAFHTGLRMRIGLHTGPVIAGIIGRNKFIYDLWGDTVNTASRMESHSQPGRIQVTKAVYDRLQEQYDFRQRGAVNVKGKGLMTTYYLLRRKTASATAKGASPTTG